MSSTNLGVIRPPPALREIVDKTAQFIASHGRAFQSRIAHKDKVKIQFLQPDHIYNAYYEQQVQAAKDGQDDPGKVASQDQQQQQPGH